MGIKNVRISQRWLGDAKDNRPRMQFIKRKYHIKFLAFKNYPSSKKGYGQTDKDRQTDRQIDIDKVRQTTTYRQTQDTHPSVNFAVEIV